MNYVNPTTKESVTALERDVKNEDVIRLLRTTTTNLIYVATLLNYNQT